MAIAGPEELERYVDHLRALPFVEKAEVRAEADRGGHGARDARLTLRTNRRAYEFLVEVKRSHLTRVMAEALVARAGRGRSQPRILFAPHIGRPLARLLAGNEMNFVDLAGNCRLALGEDHVAVIEGKPPEGAPSTRRGLGVSGYLTLFTVLARPDLMDEPVRTLAAAAGVSKSAAASTLDGLKREGLVGRGGSRHRLLQPQVILERWLAGYSGVVRPRWLLGPYTTQDRDPSALEKRITGVLGESTPWAWGGGAAAMRLTRHYRGETTVLHVSTHAAGVPARLHALPHSDGSLLVLRTPGKVAFEGVRPRTAHPLLVYTELLATGGERAREAAHDIWERFLKDLA